MKKLQNQNGIKKAFTLTEVLITLAILGVLATIAIKSSLGHYQDTIMIAKLAKTYQTLGEAFNKAIAAHGPIAEERVRNIEENDEGKCDITYGKLGQYSKNWFIKITEPPSHELQMEAATNAKTFRTKIQQFLPIKSLPSEKRTYSCLNNNCQDMPVSIKNLSVYNNIPQVELRDGTILSIIIDNPACDSNFGENRFSSGCGYIIADVNGKDAPNTYGIDVFGFLITKYGIYPAGNNFITNISCTNQEVCCDEDYNNGLSIEQYCIKNYQEDTAQPTIYEAVNGIGCTAWVLYKKNFDYINKASKDIAWE